LNILVIVYILSTRNIIKYILPSVTVDSTILNGLSKGIANIALFIFLTLLVPAPFAIANQFRKKRLIKTKRSLDKIKVLDWKSFEDLVGEAFRQTGFIVEDNTVNGADGGELVFLINDISTTNDSTQTVNEKPDSLSISNSCPKCASKLVLRTATINAKSAIYSI
jgi:hypothetical protein